MYSYDLCSSVGEELPDIKITKGLCTAIGLVGSIRLFKVFEKRSKEIKKRLKNKYYSKRKVFPLFNIINGCAKNGKWRLFWYITNDYRLTYNRRTYEWAAYYGRMDVLSYLWKIHKPKYINLNERNDLLLKALEGYIDKPSIKRKDVINQLIDMWSLSSFEHRDGPYKELVKYIVKSDVEEWLDKLWEDTRFTKYQITSYIIELGKVDVLKRILDGNKTLGNIDTMIWSTSKYKSINCFKYLLDAYEPSKDLLFYYIVIRKFSEALKWLVEIESPLIKNFHIKTISEKYLDGKLDNLKFLEENGYPYFSYTEHHACLCYHGGYFFDYVCRKWLKDKGYCKCT